ncbi:MAG: nitrogenase component 1 [Gammaproteobacteria bacterium]|nr:nitrogenase component 1 [Gammaproteobacteria bacterium]
MNDSQPQFKRQELHTPSSFEGVVWALAGIEDARTIIHSAPGYYFNVHNNMLLNDWPAELYTSHLKLSSVMKGGEEQLADVIDAITEQRPAALFVVTAPVTETSQDDAEGVCARIGYPNTVVVRPAIGQSCNEGKETAFQALVDMMDGDAEKQPRSVNLIGPALCMFNWRADVYELQRMLNDIGVHVNAVLSGGATFEEIRNAPAAELNICMYPYDCGQETAAVMQEKFGIPYMADIVPIGFDNSLRWLEQIAGHFDLDIRDHLARCVKNATHFIRSNMIFGSTFELSTALSFENHNTYALGIAECFKKEVGIRVPLVSLSNADAAERVAASCDEVLVSPTLDLKKEKIVNSGPNLIFGNFYDQKMSAEEGFQNFVVADIPTAGYVSSEVGPFMGLMGAKHLVQTAVNSTVTKLLIETKGDVAGEVSAGGVDWDVAAEQALHQVSHAVPHFVRTFAVKKIHEASQKLARERGTHVTVDVVRDAAESFTPARFHAKFAAIFDAAELDGGS